MMIAGIMRIADMNIVYFAPTLSSKNPARGKEIIPPAENNMLSTLTTVARILEGMNL